MVDQNEPGDEAGPVIDLERALAGLKPSRSQIDRDRFLFLAGKTAAEAERRQTRFTAWAWPASTFFSTGAALVLLTLLLSRSSTTSSREAMELRSASAQPIDSASARSLVASRNDNLDNKAALALELETETSEPSLADVADLDSGAPFNSLRLRYGRVTSKGTAVAEPAPVSRGPLAPPPMEPPRTQRELLQEFLKADRRLAQASLENQAG
jgi:hypothetical protein